MAETLWRSPKKVVLDPMMGSGTIPVLAAHRGHHAIGFDIDPLALLIARTWGRPLETERYVETAAKVAAEARESAKTPFTPSDAETAAFLDYWFDEQANIKRAALAAAIRRRRTYRDALWCAFSRLIITKDASVSRPATSPTAGRTASEISPPWT